MRIIVSIANRESLAAKIYDEIESQLDKYYIDFSNFLDIKYMIFDDPFSFRSQIRREFFDKLFWR